MNTTFSFRDTDNKEPAECETLYMSTSFLQSNHNDEQISIGVLEKDAIGTNGTISMQVVTFSKSKPYCDVATVNLTENEIDLVIKGLQDAKNRMMTFKAKHNENKIEGD